MAENIKELLRKMPLINKKLINYEKKIDNFKMPNRSEVLWMYRTYYKLMPELFERKIEIYTKREVNKLLNILIFKLIFS